jgi:hypothetical protein
MSYHYSGPDWGFPYGDARLDLTDLYAFPVVVPERTAGSVLQTACVIMSGRALGSGGRTCMK